MVDNRLLLSQLVLHGLNQSSAAEAIGMNRQTWYVRMLNGNWKRAEMGAIRQLLDLDQKEFEAIFYPDYTPECKGGEEDEDHFGADTGRV